MGEVKTKQEKDLEKKQWDELYEYVRSEILKYNKDMKLPKMLVLRLRGLRQGKFMANNKTKSMGNYSFEVILNTFKINKYDILRALCDNGKFKDENHKYNYMMVIIESKINDTYIRMNRAKKMEELEENLEININEENKAKYIPKTKEVNNDRLKDLL